MKASSAADDGAASLAIGKAKSSAQKSIAKAKPQPTPARKQATVEPAQPKTKAASAKDNHQPAVAPDITDFEREEIIAAIREVFTQNAILERDAAIREVSHTLGFARTGKRIAKEIDSALIAAVKRRIIANERGILFLLSRHITDFTREEQINALLGAMGRGWQERDDAIRAAARYLGYTRTGARIQKTFKSVINGAIRRGLLEAHRGQIRKAK